MPVTGVTTTLKVGNLVRIMPWVEAQHVFRYWTAVNPDQLRLYKTLVFHVLRFDDDGIHGLYAQLVPNDGTRHVGSFWVKTCLLTLASDPELV